jgi:hypothetical protein
MAHSFENENMKNENACEVLENDTMEEEYLQDYEINPKPQTKSN